jgi:lipid-binding SYLF domain-containing protein
MKHEIRNRIFGVIGTAMLISLAVIPALAQKSVQRARAEAGEATALLNTVMSDSTKSIPRSLLRQAQAIAVFTNVKKGGFIIGGTKGDGVIARRTGKTWGPPVYYDIGGADIGFQIGAKEGDFILLFMTESALNDLLADDLELTAGLGVTAGPVGENAGATSSKNSNVYVYARSKGAFAGATIGGASIKANNSINEELYKMRGGAVLADPSKVKLSTLPAELQSFSNTVAKYSN